MIDNISETQSSHLPKKEPLVHLDLPKPDLINAERFASLPDAPIKTEVRLPEKKVKELAKTQARTTDINYKSKQQQQQQGSHPAGKPTDPKK